MESTFDTRGGQVPERHALAPHRQLDTICLVPPQGQAQVTLALNWTSLMPRKPKVSWELWGNSNGEGRYGSTVVQQYSSYQYSE